MSFHDSIQIILDNLVILSIAPSALFSLPFAYLQFTKRAYKEFGFHLKRLINSSKRSLDTSVRHRDSILNTLVINAADDVKDGLSDQEIIGNAFVFLFAGHETTYEIS